MISVSPVGYEVQFSPLGPGENLVDNAPGGGQVILGRDAPATVGNPYTSLATRIKVTQCNYGSVGSAEIHTSITEQPFGDFMAECRKNLVGAVVSITADTSLVNLAGSRKTTKVFDGYVDIPEYNLAANSLVIPCRDRSSILLENDVQARQLSEQLIYQIVEELVFDAGFTTDAQLSLISTSGPAALKYGTFIRNSRSVVAHKVSAWQMIQRMADAIGYVAFATQDDKFYFGPRVRTDLPALQIVWGGANAQGDILGEPTVTHTTMRNGAFHVQVASHDPNSGGQSQASVTYANPQWGYGATPVGFQTGLTEAQARAQYGQIQVYDFYAEGLTIDALKNKALAHALDIQAHELIVKCEILGNASVEVGQAVSFINTGLPTLDSVMFFVSSVSHDIEIGQHGAKAKGFTTRLVAWQSQGGK